MPELPDVTVYVEALERRLVGRRLEGFAVHSLFLLRTVDPPLDALLGAEVCGVRRLGKRVVLAFEGELFLVLHLMIAGRFRWRDTGAKGRSPARITLAELTFANGTLVLTEAG